jgi:iron(III) transport system permease protein
LLLQGVFVRAGQTAVIGGRGFREHRVELGAWRWPTRALIALYLLFTSVFPVLGLLLVSLQRFWTPNIVWEQLTLMNYQVVILQNPRTSQALLHSVGIGALGATIGMLIATLLMWFVQRPSNASRRLVDSLTALPATIPHTVMGVSFLYAFSRPPVRIYGTWLLLLLAYLTMFLPQAARAASSAVSGVGRELSEASHVFGASGAGTFARVVLPLALPGLLAGWVILFIYMVGELTASALLSGTSNLVVGRVLLDLWENGSFPQLAAMAMVMTALDSLLVLLVFRAVRRRFSVTVS